MPYRKIRPHRAGSLPSTGSPGAGATTATPGPAVARKTAHSASTVSARLLWCIDSLSDIGAVWDPIGLQIELARLALAGEHGLTNDEIDKLELYARRWSRTDERLQRMFIEHAKKDKFARIVLWQILIARNPRYFGTWIDRCLEAMWIETHGYPSSIGLMPVWHVRKGEGQ